MKKFIGAAAAIGLALLPTVSLAASFVVRDDYASGATERVEGNLYVISGSVSVGAQVDGDLSAAGNTIAVAGSVGGDVAAAGATIQLLGSVAGDVRAIGGQISVSSRVRGDMDAIGGTIRLLPGAIIDGDLSTLGSDVIIDGAVNGNVTVRGGHLTINGAVTGSVDARLDDKLTLGSGARIGGGLTYRAPRETVIGPDVTIAGPVSYEPAKSEHRAAKGAAIFAVLGVLTAMKTLAYLGFAALIVWRWRRQAVEVMQEGKDAILPSIGRGFVYAILTPIAAALLLVSFIGSIVGGLLFAAYGAAMVIASVLAGMFFGAGLEMVLRKQPVLYLNWRNALGGVILFSLVGLVPVVGWIVRLALTLLMFGVLAHRATRALSR